MMAYFAVIIAENAVAFVVCFMTKASGSREETCGEYPSKHELISACFRLPIAVTMFHRFFELCLVLLPLFSGYKGKTMTKLRSGGRKLDQIKGYFQAENSHS